MRPEVRMARLLDAITRWQSGGLSCLEAAEFLGISERQFRRLRDRYEEDGADGLIDRRRGRASGKRVAVDRIEWVLEQYRTRYFDFTAKHFHEHLVRDHGFKLSYTWTKLALQAAGLVKRAPRKSAHRKKRLRRPLPGMMLFQDGSTHAWIAGKPDFDLIVTLDDATGAIYSAFFVDEEGTVSSLRGISEVISRHGLFSSFYTDRGSHYFYTPKVDGPVDKNRLTQVGRALKQLGIEHIPSYSPEGRGRMERAFGTIQGRLPQELRISGIDTIDAANHYLIERFVPAYNATFAVKAAEEGTAFVPFLGNLAEILCIQEDRVVGRDNCVRYNGLSLQIPEQVHRHHYVKAIVQVHEYLDGTLAVFHGPRCLARYGAGGILQQPGQVAA
jgi:transposase